ncbi:acidic fibroblast growth factor intracellular-binding protein [Huso huso]|uniref:Acidic fibroblast growth factor intracellular-binding protein n=1 Tax=Huso huso TaxID=61971 RepID=A0ABR0Y147_HUSHU
MAMELDVFVGNTTIMDEDVYLLWLDGYTVSDAVSMRMKSGILEQCGASQDVLESDTMDHYRTFQMTERLLHNPSKLVNQLLFQIPPHRQNMLIERWGGGGGGGGRGSIGKRTPLSTLQSCIEVYRKESSTLNTAELYRVNGLLSACFVSCRDYAAIVFFANSRFETGKKKLQYLTFEDFAFCAEQLIQNWTLGAVLQKFQPQLSVTPFLLALIRSPFFLPSLVCTALRGKLQVFSEMEGSFKNLSRGLVNIAGKLMNNKDVRDLFIDLVEKVGGEGGFDEEQGGLAKLVQNSPADYSIIGLSGWSSALKSGADDRVRGRSGLGLIPRSECSETAAWVCGDRYFS